MKAEVVIELDDDTSVEVSVELDRGDAFSTEGVRSTAETLLLSATQAAGRVLRVIEPDPGPPPPG